MLKKLMISAAISALMVSGALAQATPPAASDGGAKFIASQSQDQWVFSKFKGTDVLGPDNAHIGDVSDLLFDKNGRIAGVIVGVGGFLGIGEKYVAIDLSAFQVVPADVNSTTASKSDDPSNIKMRVSLTKDQLKQAQYYKPSPTMGQGQRALPSTAR